MYTHEDLCKMSIDELNRVKLSEISDDISDVCSGVAS